METDRQRLTWADIDRLNSKRRMAKVAPILNEEAIPSNKEPLPRDLALRALADAY